MRKTLTLFALCGAAALGCNADSLTNNDTGDGGLFDDAGHRINADAACGAVRASATLQKAPVDIIFVIDNSGSMTEEITQVQARINTNFASIIAASGLDYRIIMVSRHGSATAAQSICINAPLAGNASCNPVPAAPSNTANFYHYSVEIASTDSYERILATYRLADTTARGGFNLAPNGWAAWLRPNAVKTFLEISDDNINGTLPGGATSNAANFDTALLALDPQQFGTAAKRNYIFHAICGVVENPAGATVPWPATSPEQATKCTGNGGGSVNASPQHQKLAILTGGIRYPICQYNNYDSAFQAVASSVISGAAISCDFNVPPAPMGKEYILTTAQLEFTPSNGAPARIFKQVPDSGSCAADSFYIAANHVYLCGTTCTDVQADTGAKIEFLLECNVLNG